MLLLWVPDLLPGKSRTENMKIESNYRELEGNREYECALSKFRSSDPDTLHPRIQRTDEYDFWLHFGHH